MGNPNLGEQELLKLLKRKNLPREAVQGIASRREASHSYRIKLSIAQHPRCPRQVALPLLKFLFLFDLLKVCQSPAVPADVKMVAEEMILKRGEGIPRGEKMSLARRATGRVAASLLLSHDNELIAAALDNPFLTEAHVLKVLSRTVGVDELLVGKVARHAKWSRRYHIRLSLLRNPSLPFHQVLAFVPDLTVSDLRTICLDQKNEREGPQVSVDLLRRTFEGPKAKTQIEILRHGSREVGRREETFPLSEENTFTKEHAWAYQPSTYSW